MFKIDRFTIPHPFLLIASESKIGLAQIHTDDSKLVKFFIKCKKYAPQAKDAELIFLKSFEDHLLSERKLDPYQKVRLLAHCPELLPGREQNFTEAYRGFEEVLFSDSFNMTLKKAQKVSSWVRQKSVAPLVPVPMDFQVQSSDGQKLVLDRLTWGKLVPACRQMGLEDASKPRPLRLPAKLLHAIDQFIKRSTLPDLTIDELFELLKAENFQFPELKEACVDALKKQINDNTVYQILRVALNVKSNTLIQACFGFLDVDFSKYSTSDKILSAPLYLHWDPVQGISVTLEQMTEKSRRILESFSSDIYGITLFNGDLIPVILADDKTFPHVREVGLPISVSDLSLINPVAKLFPYAKECSMFPGLYKQLLPKHVKKWTNIEIFSLQEFDQDLRKKPLFPKVKLCTTWGLHGTQFAVKDGIIFGQIATTNKSVDLTSFPKLLTDDLLFTILGSCHSTYNFSINCVNLTEASCRAFLHFFSNVYITNSKTTVTFNLTNMSEGLLNRIRSEIQSHFPKCIIGVSKTGNNAYIVRFDLRAYSKGE